MFRFVRPLMPYASGELNKITILCSIVQGHKNVDCEVCVTSYPDNALAMTDIVEDRKKGHKDAWDCAMTLQTSGERFDSFSVKGAQLNQPLLEVSGTCEGCGETPYAKLLTQSCRMFRAWMR